MKRVPPSMEKRKELNRLLNGELDLDGRAFVGLLIRLIVEYFLQKLLEDEQTAVLGRERYDRNDDAGGPSRNGYENGRIRTAEGVFRVRLPQIRGLGRPFQSAIWSRVSRTTDALTRLVQEMWVRGMSQLDVEEALQAATGSFVLSDSAVSVMTRELFEQYEAFRKRDLGVYDVAFLFLDAVYEPLRRHGCDVAILCAWGICTDGSKVLLGLSTSNTESTAASVSFLRDLVARGLRAPLTITTDGAPGLIAAVDRVWPKSHRIRCWFHKMQNVQSKVPDTAWPEFKALLCDVRDAPTIAAAKQRLHEIAQKHGAAFPEAVRCLEEDQDALLNHLRVPMTRVQPMIRTTNLVERTFVEERRRTKVIPTLWDEHAALKLIFATLLRVEDRWRARQFSQVEEQRLKQMLVGVRADDTEEDAPTQSNKRTRRSAGDVADNFYRKTGS